MVRVAVFASGGGSNLQALMDRFREDDAPARVALVISDRADAGALERARRNGIATEVIAADARPPGDVEAETIAKLEAAEIGLIALAGYLRLVPAGVVQRWAGRILNTHPALLPAFGGKGMYGMHVHRAVLAAGALVSGATVHLVSEQYDEGKPLVQWPVPVLRGDTAETLAARVLAVEHVLYPLAVELAAHAIATGRDLASVTSMLWGSRAWGFDADGGAFGWLDEETVLAAPLRRLLGLSDPEE
ncbi:MAG: phosphoribosylglycinamide formyltransferase [Gemmatimonadetes bacterium]|nr:phosphoribosylglycinamide formyltransferase [Gemmatimonadota bacterium]